MPKNTHPSGLYTLHGEDIVNEKSDNYEMMNLTTGKVVKIQKEKQKLFWIF